MTPRLPHPEEATTLHEKIEAAIHLAAQLGEDSAFDFVHGRGLHQMRLTIRHELAQLCDVYDEDGNLIPRDGRDVPTRSDWAALLEEVVKEAEYGEGVPQPLAERIAQYLDAIYNPPVRRQQSPGENNRYLAMLIGSELSDVIRSRFAVEHAEIKKRAQSIADEMFPVSNGAA